MRNLKTVLAAVAAVFALAIAVAGPAAHAQKSAQVPACKADPIVSADANTGTLEIAGKTKTVTLSPSAVENDGAVLWRVEKAGAPTSYLFGTIHSTDPRINDLTPAFKSAFAAAKQVAIEIAEPGNEAKMSQLMAEQPSLFVYIDGTSLEQKLSPDNLATLVRVLEPAGIPAMMAPMVRPWMSSMMLAIPACERRRMAAKIPVLDERIEADARAAGKSIVSLETLESQSRALGGLPDADQMAMLRATLAYVNEIPALSETITQFYMARRIGDVWGLNIALAKAAGIDVKSFDSFEREVIIKRNIAMATRAVPLMEKAPTLVAVGALHLVGETGLVALFRKAGFTVTAIE